MSKKLWGGRFKKEMHPLLKCFSYSLSVDFKLVEAELKVNDAWVRMLARVRLITRPEMNRLLRGLKSLGKVLCAADPHKSVPSKFLRKYEDIHSLIQDQLEKKVGEVGKKIHTGRSRNDLVVTSTRLYLKGQIPELEGLIREAQRGLIAAAKKSSGAIIAGMTHMRKAQPVLLAHHLLAYVEMFEEDRARLVDCLKRVDVLSLGSAALAGSSLKLDQDYLARQLGFSKVSTNSLAAVSDRGFLTEFLSGLAILWTHLSRLSEDFILWNSEFFGFVDLDDEFATGSSLMPQKKNPDIFELIRGRSGVIFGHLQALLTMQKGLPLGYNRDLQEDKPAVFDAIMKTRITLKLLALTLASVQWNRKAMETSVEDDVLFATDILEYLVRKSVPFAEAHELVGRIVRASAEEQKPMREFSLPEWKRYGKVFDSDIYDLFQPRTSVAAKKTIGSTQPKRVRSQILKWERSLSRGSR
ncbi:MAG: argininosuccinate lyase [Candidatus Omnitrophota bacterium]|nr:argininosuccinate lyase [Candidatus Omnitrophota bacterium]